MSDEQSDEEVTRYTSVKLPKVLAVKINAIAENEGYRSVSEFVLEATREHLKRLITERRESN